VSDGGASARTTFLMSHRTPPNGRDRCSVHHFVVPPDAIAGETVRFSPAQRHQIARVLRLQRPYVIGIVITVAVVLGFELFNTAIESVVDLMTVAHHPLAKIAKDLSAGMLLIASIASVAVGALILGPPLWARLFR